MDTRPSEESSDELWTKEKYGIWWGEYKKGVMKAAKEGDTSEFYKFSLFSSKHIHFCFCFLCVHIMSLISRISFIFFHLFKFMFIIYWSTVDLQSCAGLKCATVIQLYIYSFFNIFPHIDYYRIFSRVSCAIQEALADYFIYSSVFLC